MFEFSSHSKVHHIKSFDDNSFLWKLWCSGYLCWNFRRMHYKLILRFAMRWSNEFNSVRSMISSGKFKFSYPQRNYEWTFLIFLAPFNMHSVEFCSMDGLTFLVVGKFIGYEREQWLRYSSNFHFGSCVPVAHRIEIIKSSQFSRCLKLETYHMVESKFHEPSISICGIFCNCSVKCSWKLRWRVH